MAATAGLSLTLDPMGKMFQNASSLKPLGQLKPNCPGMIIGRSSTNFLFYMPIGNPRWPPLPMIIPGQFGFNCPSGFREEVFWNIFPIGFNVKLSPAVTLDPTGKMFQNASFLKPLGQLKPNCPGMIIGRSSTKFLFFYADRKFKMAATVLPKPPFWISYRNKKRKVCRGPSNEHSCTVWL
jgi:hypothetical protein